jgi:hypothetical protein
VDESSPDSLERRESTSSDVEKIFDAARRVPPESRSQFVETACAGRPEVRREVLELLSRGDDAQAFFARLEQHVGPLREEAAEERSSGSPPEAVSELAPGTEIGPYRIVGRVGVGGMGTVYSARDPRLHREVALKLLPPWLAADPRAAERFRNEARAAAALDHPNICTIYEIGMDGDGGPFIAMALYRGETLKERIKRDRLPVGEAVEIAAAIARALAAARARGIVHRDVKPGNVMLTEDGLIKLLDFGLARLEDSAHSRPGLVRGTVAYLAPEQVRGDAVGPAADLWALGVVLYEMLAGRRPFTGGRDRARFHAILHEEPPPLEELRPEVPEALAQTVERLLRKDPEERYASAEELLADLESERAARSPAASTTTTRVAQRPTGIRRPALWIAAAAMLAGATAVAVWAVRRAPAQLLDPARVAVLPFDISGAAPPFAYLGRGVPKLIAIELAGDSTSEVADRRRLAAALPPDVRSGRRRATPGEALQAARTIGAGRVVLGDVATLPGRVTLTASLYEVATGRAEPQVHADGAPDSLPALVDRLVGELLSVEAGEGRRLFSLTTDSLRALKLFLKGQTAFDEGRSDTALADFVTAARIDTGFALAELMAWRANNFSMRGAPFNYVDAWRHQDRLSARDRELVNHLVGPNGPDAYEPIQRPLNRFRELVRRQPESRGAWMTYAGWLPLGEGPTPRPDSSVLREQSRAYARVLALDSASIAPLAGLYDDAVILGDTAAARGYARRYLSETSSGLGPEAWRCVLEAFSSGRSGRPAMAEVLALADSVRPTAAGECLATLYNLGGRRYLPEAATPRYALAQHLLARVPEKPGILRFGWQVLTAIQKDGGRPSANMRLENSLLHVGYLDTLGYLKVRVRDGLWWDGDTLAATRAASELEARVAAHPPRSASDPTTDGLCVVGEWRLHSGDTASAAPIARRLRALGGDLGRFEEIFPLYCGRVLGAWIATQEGAEGAADSLATLASADADRPWRGPLVKEADLILSHLLQSEGDLPAAYAVFHRDRFLLPLYNSTILRTRGHLATLLGDTAAAIDAYRLYLTFRTHPEPEWLGDLARVKETLARLERRAAPRRGPASLP